MSGRNRTFNPTRWRCKPQWAYCHSCSSCRKSWAWASLVHSKKVTVSEGTMTWGYIVGKDTIKKVEWSFAGARFSTWRKLRARRPLVKAYVILQHQEKVRSRIFATQELVKLHQQSEEDSGTFEFKNHNTLLLLSCPKAGWSELEGTRGERSGPKYTKPHLSIPRLKGAGWTGTSPSPLRPWSGKRGNGLWIMLPLKRKLTKA